MATLERDSALAETSKVKDSFFHEIDSALAEVSKLKESLSAVKETGFREFLRTRDSSVSLEELTTIRSLKVKKESGWLSLTTTMARVLYIGHALRSFMMRLRNIGKMGNALGIDSSSDGEHEESAAEHDSSDGKLSQQDEDGTRDADGGGTAGCW